MAGVHVVSLLFVLHGNSFIHILPNTTDVLPADVRLEYSSYDLTQQHKHFCFVSFCAY